MFKFFIALGPDLDLWFSKAWPGSGSRGKSAGSSSLMIPQCAYRQDVTILSTESKSFAPRVLLGWFLVCGSGRGSDHCGCGPLHRQRRSSRLAYITL
mgnify:CR=1 FL=1